MAIVKHRFIEHKIDSQTETLIIGTFNPETPDNEANFFYSRKRNFLWTLIPTAFRDDILKGKSKEEKLSYIKLRKIDFIDLISEVNVEEPNNYKDNYLDQKVSKWRDDITTEINKLKNIKRVGFTRKSFADVPNMKTEIEKIKKTCDEYNIFFQYLTTPVRFYSKDKQKQWTDFLNHA